MTHHDESSIMTHPIDDSYLVHFSSVLLQSVSNRDSRLSVKGNIAQRHNLYDVIGYNDIIDYDVIITSHDPRQIGHLEISKISLNFK